MLIITTGLYSVHFPSHPIYYLDWYCQLTQLVVFFSGPTGITETFFETEKAEAKEGNNLSSIIVVTVCGSTS